MNLEEKKIELELKTIELQNRKLELEEKLLIQKSETEKKDLINNKRKIDPIYATVFVAFIGFFSTTVATIVNNYNQNSLERQKFESELIKKSLEEQSVENKIKSLKLLSTLQLIKNEEVKIALDKFLQDSTKAAENLPSNEEGKPIPYIGKGLKEQKFETYLNKLDFSTWKPQMIVIHHTVSPTLAQWEKINTKTRLDNFAKIMGANQWNSGPHLIIDRDSIWIFSPLNKPGIHCRGWNKTSIGIEMVGNYDVDKLDEKVLQNTIDAIVPILKKFNLNQSSVMFHSESPEARGKSCPGKNVDKSLILAKISSALQRPAKQTTWPTDSKNK